MTTGSPALVKLFSMKHEAFYIDYVCYHVIPEDKFTNEEIKELRELDESSFKTGNDHFIANFLPDDIRPAHVKKLQLQ